MARHWKWVLAVAIIGILVSSFSDVAFAISNSTQTNGTITNSTLMNATAVNATIPEPVSNQTSPINSTKLIPTWVKGIAGFWADGKISDLDFQQAIQFLVNTGIIKVHNATSVISDLQMTAQTNQTDSIAPAEKIQAPFNWNNFYNASLYWQNGNITDTEFFKTVQAAIDSGEFGPFNGTQDEKGKTFQETVQNSIPATHEIPFSKYYEGSQITIPVGDYVEWINDLNQTHTVTSGTKATGFDRVLGDISVPAGGKTGFTFMAAGDYNLFSNYAWDNLNMTIHVIPNYHDVEVPSDLKTMITIHSKNQDKNGTSQNIEELYRLGFVNNP